ncbi:MAG: cytochrome b N-terminal domain-containing protein [Deltaproteobacteria bacterium]|nr:cytochrome b N-terminal domain-containing protein [Deltaproteobacteria bacterium]
MSAGRIQTKISSALPRIGLSSLVLCLASGMVLIFYYRPAGEVFANVEEITTLVPYGWFFRQLHYGSGQAFVILMFLHTLDHFLKRRYVHYPMRVWVTLILALLLSFFTLFTGFILKADQEGVFAGRIFMNILQTIPIVGASISKLFIVSGNDFFFLPYIYHCFFLPILIVYLIRHHIRDWLPNRGFMMAGGACLFLYALLIKPGVVFPPDAVTPSVEGPWFFLGMQRLLKAAPPLWAGIVMPGVFMMCVFLLPLTRKRGEFSASAGWLLWGKVDWLRYAVIFMFFVYTGLTVKAMIWGP